MSRNRSPLQKRVSRKADEPKSIFDTSAVKRPSRSPNKRRINIFGDEDEAGANGPPKLNIAQRGSKPTGKTDMSRYNMKDSVHPRKMPGSTKNPAFLGDNSFSKLKQEDARVKPNLNVFHTGNVADIISKSKKQNTDAKQPVNNVRHNQLLRKPNEASFETSKNNTLYDDIDPENAFLTQRVKQPRLSSMSQNNPNLTGKIGTLRQNQSQSQRQIVGSMSKGNLSRERIKSKNRLVSKERRMDRYSRRNDRKSRSPGGGIKLKFGEGRKSRRNSQMNSQATEQSIRVEPLRKPSKPIRSTSRNPPKQLQKNIFGKFIQKEEEEQEKRPKQTQPDAASQITPRDDKSEMHSFDTDPESSMINSTSQIHSNLDVSGNFSRISNVTDRSISRHRPSKPRIFQDEEVVAPRMVIRRGASVGKKAQSPLGAHLSKMKINDLELKVGKLEKELEMEKERSGIYKKENAVLKASESQKERNEQNREELGREVKRLEEMVRERDRALERVKGHNQRLESDKNQLMVNLDKDGREMLRERDQNELLKKKLTEAESRLKMEQFKRQEKEKVFESELAGKQREIELLTQRKTELETEVEILQKGGAQTSQSSRLEMHIDSLKQSLKQREEILLLKEKRIKDLEMDQMRNTRRSEQEELARLKAEELVKQLREDLRNQKRAQREGQSGAEAESEELRRQVEDLEEQVRGLKSKAGGARKGGAEGEGEVEVLRYENDKMRKNNKLLEMKVAEMKSLKSKAEKSGERRQKEVWELKQKVKEMEDLKTKMEALNKDYNIMKRTKELIEKDLSRSMLKIGNALQLVNTVKLKNRERDKLMNALVGVN